jgi:hypothetical protein
MEGHVPGAAGGLMQQEQYRQRARSAGVVRFLPTP